MGRAIDTEKDIDKLKAEMSTLKAEVSTLKTAFEGLAVTVDTLKDTAPTRKAVDLHPEPKATKKTKKAELATEEV